MKELKKVSCDLKDKKMIKKSIIGCEEWGALTALNIPALKMRIDTGAATSALHAFNIELHQSEGNEFVTFDIHPLQKSHKIIQHCRADTIDRRVVKSSSGEKQRRVVISTPLTVGQNTWDIQVTLTNRDAMGYRMLLGREAMATRFLVDPDLSFVGGDISREDLKALYSSF